LGSDLGDSLTHGASPYHAYSFKNWFHLSIIAELFFLAYRQGWG